MNSKVSILNIIKFSGAFIAFIIGSGFATGQEIMQFFSRNGWYSLISILISLILFTYFSSQIISAGYDYGGNHNYAPYKYFCGNRIGAFYEYFVPILLFISVVVMISGSGATLKEFYGLNYYVGCALMSILVLTAFICGLDKLISIIELIGPIIVVFSLFVGLKILFENLYALKDISKTMIDINNIKTNNNCIKSGILYPAYNMVSGLFFFTTLGNSANNRQEAKYGAILGSLSIMIVILVMNLALLSKIKDVYTLSIPTLYFAKSISPILGYIFSIILLCGIFSTAAPNFWTICDKISKKYKYNSKIIALIISILSFLFGLLPFKKLVGSIYPLTGILGIILFLCIFFKNIKERII